MVVEKMALYGGVKLVNIVSQWVEQQMTVNRSNLIGDTYLCVVLTALSLYMMITAESSHTCNLCEQPGLD
jgi:hypothetical protein